MKGYKEEATGFKGSNKGDANNKGCNSNGCNSNGGWQRQRLGGAAMAVWGTVEGQGLRLSITEMPDRQLRGTAMWSTMADSGGGVGAGGCGRDCGDDGGSRGGSCGGSLGG
jgi:hypothetical protein